jgi:AcrR family transcriptional regulator
LTHAEIASAALAIVDRDGLAALSMRTVADELGMGAMSLYRYVTDREHIERLAVDLVLSEVDTDLPARLGWRARVTTLVLRARAAADAHPAILPLLLVHRSTSEHATRWGEAMLRTLADAGFAGTKRVIAFRSLLSYLFGALQVARLSALSGSGTRALGELPEDKFPMLVETARHAQRIDPDSEFLQGLAVVLRGLERRTG